MLKRIKCILALLLVAAIATAGVSPACAFVGGKSLTVEICTEDGSIKTVTLAGKTGGETHKSGQHAHKDTDCAFCFSHNHNSAHLANASLGAPLSADYKMSGAGTAVPLVFSLKSFESTGPPSRLHS